MKIAIIIPNIVESLPYVNNYTDVFDKMKADYEIICWNRNELNSVSQIANKTHIFNHPGLESNSLLKKMYDYWLFSRFVIKCLKRNKYDYLTVHTIVCGIFLYKFIKKKYEGRYIFDIRDYSSIVPFVVNKIEKLINSSSFSVISSLGYKSWLPQKNDYILGHNVRRNIIENSMSISKKGTDKQFNEIITILTIGQIRDFEPNSRIIDSFGNKDNCKVIFAGIGLEKERLENFSMSKYSNIHFTGRYQKEEENNIVKMADFINIVLPPSPYFRTQIANRFYLSLTSRKPLIVNEESIHARFVEKYKLGIVINSTDNIHDKVMAYIESFNKNEFDKACEDIIAIIFNDIQKFESEIIKHFT